MDETLLPDFLRPPSGLLEQVSLPFPLLLVMGVAVEAPAVVVPAAAAAKIVARVVGADVIRQESCPGARLGEG
eukprot:CAMPEP_0206491300 /NCGR_PEP_ID=MMETSP0324_2-20121206/44869_1 /ASSEMBLY_ACC=CAM_ASM_000836 /TAXON_ID=2866 /ORGANISM="Crypthecodinium cohnii, Strain Seligo" /LENGTH=72 /DNA_ID=CAMNT_0053972375 /DNA_START=660 /DNA_END=878 /DNA_ORIENTATION=-